ncbi:MAG: Crp/Fnr family transcriptional regulator, partial [Bacteroidia bacterium]|nr:Crp/Fnr family transcriptional regulator [Bacteroidia bacterium]
DLVTVLLGEGEFFGHLSLLESNEYLENAIAIEETELALIPDVDFKSLIFSNRDVAHKFIKILAKDVKENEDRLLKMAFGTIRERLADALLKLYNTDENKVMSVRITRENLAGIVGTVPESLIRTLSEFKEANLIEINGREIVLKDEHRIKQMAGL